MRRPLDWHQAEARIAAAITEGTSLGRPGSSERKVLAGNHASQRLGYGGERGFLVRIGVESQETIELPWSMVETCYRDLVHCGYDGDVFRRH